MGTDHNRNGEIQKNYLTLKVLIDYIDRDARGYGGVKTINVLQSVCLLPHNTCPSDGSLITFLCSKKTSKLEATTRDRSNVRTREHDYVTVPNMTSETDEHGNLALHLFLSNESHVRGGNAEIVATLENQILSALLHRYHEAISIPNSSGDQPLQIAMKAGRRRVLPPLLAAYPDAVFSDESTLDIKFYVHVLGCMSVPSIFFFKGGDMGNISDDDEKQANIRRCFTTMFHLVRARPNITSLVGSGIPESNEGGADITLGSKDGLLERMTKKNWWNNIKIIVGKIR
ncbi:hypothetical protein ACHAXA_010354 [Cyclostephanos tholiformis]|uniref:Uncharacterized protein n=1 Tax=Cyclostephanos tholiformis TaxID=382380 RepID=A0ABD3RSX6_9STRA